jgi:large subunit ribosomal protein L29
MTKASELREMSDEQLGFTLKESAESLFRLRIKAQTERLNAPSELRKARRTIARAKTIQTERARAAAASSAASTGAATTGAAAKVSAPASAGPATKPFAEKKPVSNARPVGGGKKTDKQGTK